jgi:hypothetical protein
MGNVLVMSGLDLDDLDRLNIQFINLIDFEQRAPTRASVWLWGGLWFVRK